MASASPLQLRHSQSDKKLSSAARTSASSHSSLFTRLRRGHLGNSRVKVPRTLIKYFYNNYLKQHFYDC